MEGTLRSKKREPWQISLKQRHHIAATSILAVLVTPRSNPGDDVAHTNGKPNWILAALSTEVISTHPLVSFQGVVPANARLPTQREWSCLKSLLRFEVHKPSCFQRLCNRKYISEKLRNVDKDHRSDV